MYVPDNVIAPPAKRNIKILRVGADMLLQIFREMDGTRLVRCDGIPADAKVVGIITDRIWNTIELAVESAEFPEVLAEYVAEALEPKFTLITPEPCGAQPRPAPTLPNPNIYLKTGKPVDGAQH